MEFAKPITLNNLKNIQSIICAVASTKDLTQQDLTQYNFFYDWSEKLKNFPIIINTIKDHFPKFKIKAVAIVVLLPRSKLNIHRDHNDDVSLGTYSFNIPILNCENTFTAFYKCNTSSTIKYLSNNIPYYHMYNEEDCVEVHRIEMSQSHLINIKTPHAAINDTDKVRMTLAIRFDPESEILEE